MAWRFPMGEGLATLFAAERRIMALSRPHGVVARDQLTAAGISRNVIDNRVRAGWLRSMHRGVYAVGPVQSAQAPYLAAVMACGDPAALSHTSAAFLWRIIGREPSGPVDVTVPSRRAPARAGIRVHRVSELLPDEVTAVRRIRITAPARTLLDLASQLSPRELEQAVALAERRNLTTQAKLLSLVARYPSRPGTPKLRQLLDGPVDPALARSEAEEAFLTLIRRAGLPSPETNVAFHAYELDFLWREEGLAVEIDGYAFHSDRDSFESDRRRDAELARRGIQVLRVTWLQITAEPEATLVRVAEVLALRAGAA
jgi:very-short-patch-repair endonuclease